MNTTDGKTSQTLTLIAVSNLEKSSLNVRKTDPKAALDEMKASIAAYKGVLLQNLIVTVGKNGKYQVVAGARRLAALKSLIEEGKLPEDHAVQCQVVSDQQAYEMSLAENTVRVAMHPADEHAAYTVLVDGGATTEEVAQRFGKSVKHVEQRLRLGRAAPELIQAYRDGEMKLEALEAFTVTDDKKRQIAVYEQIKGGWQQNDPRQIRALLTDKMIRGNHKLAVFVGLDAYEAAGGAVRRDLFGEDVYLEDAVLLNRLAGEKLEGEAAALRNEGWAWVEAAFDHDWQALRGCQEIEPQYADVPPEMEELCQSIEAELAAIEAEWDATDEGDDELLESIEKKREEAGARLVKAERAIEALNRFTPEQMAAAGCSLYVEPGGTLMIEKGLVKPQDAKKAAAAAGSAPEGDQGDDMDDQPAEKPKGMPESLKRDLEAYRLGAAQVEIAKHPAIAFDLLVFKAARGVLTMQPGYDGANISFQRNYGGTASREARAFVAEQMKDLEESLPVEWLGHKTEADQFLAFQQLTDDQKHALLAFCVASTLQPKLSPASSDRLTAYDIALSQTGANVADYWRPTKDNYLSRVTREQLLGLGGDLLGESWARWRKDAKKGDLAATLHADFAKPDGLIEYYSRFAVTLTEANVAKMKNWLPEGMAFPAIEQPVEEAAEPKRKPGRPKKNAA